MNTNNIKKYAPQARREFIEAVTKRLNYLGIHTDNKGQLKISEAQVAGDVMQIDGNSFSARLEQPRRKLVERAQQQGFAQLAEQTAYTWFNRLCAIRYMELHGYLEHGFRVLSPSPLKGEGRGEGDAQGRANAAGGRMLGVAFEILDHAQDVAADLGLDRNQIVELKLAGNKDEELYRELLLGQCHKLHEAMPFLFEALDDETELLLPDNLTRTDSILRGLVDNIPESDWEQVEIIGWLYQFYISEKKDQVIGKVVKSEDIPAATQLFTPNWIVKYLVQNSVGRQWLQTYPDSGIKAQMEYYIEPAEQEPSVGAALAAITPTSIDPESIKVLDPACGSGHILIEAYNVLKAIYEERGYRSRDIPKLILENNLYGLDIDDRAAQLAGFALMMKARADDRRIFSRAIKLNVLAIQSSQSLDLPYLWRRLDLNNEIQRGSTESIFEDVQSNLADTVDDIEFKQLRSIMGLFEQAKTLGSLIQVPHNQAELLKSLTIQLQELAEQGDTMQKPAAITLLPYVQQAWLLAQQYDAVVANPPYMGSKYLNPALKDYLKKHYKGFEKDLFSASIIRNLAFSKETSQLGFMTPFVWMFISSYEDLRKKLIKEATITSLIQPELHAFFDSAFVSICGFTLSATSFKNYISSFIRLTDFYGADLQPKKTLEAIKNSSCGWFYNAKPDDFKKISGSPIVYWASQKILDLYKNECIGEKYEIREGLGTRDDEIFLRRFWEISHKNFRHGHGDEKWIKTDKGGQFRKWYGNGEFVMNWENDGYAIKNHRNPDGSLKSRPQNTQFFFKEAISWNKVGSGITSFRYRGNEWGFNDAAPSIFGVNLESILAMLNSNLLERLISFQGATLNVTTGIIKGLPSLIISNAGQIAIKAIEISKIDWNNYETSWDFTENPLIQRKQSALEAAFKQWQIQNYTAFAEMQRLEEDNNRLFIETYGLQDELTPEVPEDQITLTRADQEKDIQRLISYAIGCMMGRYSLDEPGLIYAHASNIDFDLSRYPSFPADEDGILPLTDQEWFKDDASNRFREFLQAVWGEDSLQQNLNFVAESLTLSSFKPKKGETNLDTVRRYLSNQLYKDHLQTYKKRPIYWLFSSGKQKAFECLVYLHRYNEGTLSRMRTEYVTPLLGKYDAYAEQLQKQIEDASSTAESNRLKKERDALIKKQAELRQFDDKLKHYADMRIKLDLDDGVKVNYGKFGDLLFDVKGITGKAPEVI